MVAEQPALRIDSLHAGYGPVRVLHGLSLDLPPGSVTAILGPNGVGKTTLVDAVMGLLPASAGRVLVGSVDLLRLPASARRRHGLALVPQGRRVFRSLSVEEHLGLVRRSDSGPFSRDRIFDTFPRLAERRHTPARHLSGGEQSMLAIARALSADPRILLLDEPTEGLAPLLVERVRGVVEQLRQLGLTVLLVEQNLGFALAVADRVAVMHRGTIDTVAESAAFSDVEALANLVLGGSARAIRSGPVRSSTGGHAGP